MKKHFYILAVSILFSKMLIAQSLEYGAPYTLNQSVFNIPTGLAIDPIRNKIFIVNSGNHRLLYTNTSDLLGNPTWTEFGFVADRSASNALKAPQSLAIDGAGNAFVVDTYNNEVKLYRWNAASSTFSYDANFASTTRNSVNAKNIKLPRDICIGIDGRVYLLDSGNDRILVATGADDTSWEVLVENTNWGNTYGFDVANDHTFYIADTDNHRILHIQNNGTLLHTIGNYGTGTLQFRNPRDVSIGEDGKIYIADTYNHRAVVLKADRTFYRNLGAAPLYGFIQKVKVDAQKHVYLIDSDNKSLIYFPGPNAPKPFDAYIRDYVGDSGSEPSNTAFLLSSPDILVRHHPDIDLATARANGLTSFAFEQPRYEQNNYVYIAVRNRGKHLITNVNAKLYWADPATNLNFPQFWKDTGFYQNYYDASSNSPTNSIFIPSISPRGADSVPNIDSVVVVGPIIWRPPSPESSIATDGNFHLLVRMVHINDPTEGVNGIEQVRLNNNIALRKVKVSRGPFPIGDQNTLVIKTIFPDVPDVFNDAVLDTKIENLANWVRAVSYERTLIKPVTVSPITLDNNRSNYLSNPNNNVLVEMANEAINKVLLANPAILDGPTPDPADDIDRVILVVNDNTYNGDWATTGLWPYTTSSSDIRYLSVSVQGQSNNVEQFTHGISHQFGLKDLYAYPNVEFPITHPVDPWDNMINPPNGVHPLAWSKQNATWITSNYGKIHYIPRPPKGTPPLLGQPPIHLSYQAILDSLQIGAIAIGLTEGITTFEEEHHFYWVEARNPMVGSFENNLPAKGVIAYYANKLIPQGHVPIIVRDNQLSTDHLNDAMILPSQSLAMGGTGITVRVTEERSGNEGYNVVIDYSPPVNDFNVRIRQGNPYWTSQDIWIDNMRDGSGYAAYDNVNKLGNPVYEQPIGGEDNRFFARIHNTGPGVAYDIEVEFKISAPYHTVGGEGAFDLYKVVLIDNIASGSYKDVYVVWRPADTGEPHNCVRVNLRRLVADTDSTDNWAQQNFTVRQSTTASPYKEVIFPYQLKNTNPEPTLYYFRTEGIPKNWTSSLSVKKKLLLPNETIFGELKVTPPETYPSCTNHEVIITAWKVVGHTIIREGGVTVDLQLRKQTTLTIDTQLKTCDEKQYDTYLTNYQKNNDRSNTYRKCLLVVTQGCTNPKRPNQKVVVCYRDPSGNPVYKEVMTDVNGCFQDFNPVVEGGTWQTTAYYPGDECSGAGSISVSIFVPLLTTNDQDNDGLPDDQEVQGDIDGDGLVGQLDPDSDNDGLIDGNEDPNEDTDQDGIVNVADPDSDNDGILDGKDPLPKDPKHLKYFIGLNLGGFYFDKKLPIHHACTIQFLGGIRISNKYSIGGELGFTNTFTKKNDPIRIINLNLNIDRYIPTLNPNLNGVLTVGVGTIWVKTTTTFNTPFFKLGTGAEYTLNKNFYMNLKANLLRFNDLYGVRGSLNSQLTLGISYKF